MSAKVYNLKFTLLSCCALDMIFGKRNWKSLFILRLSKFLNKEDSMEILIRDMDISWLMIHIQWKEEDKLQDRKENQIKWAKMANHAHSQSREKMENDLS